ncbi:MAG: hypothetical protein GY867_11480, partial [bacterium]|nr:hypothetical protein [bacterium]
RKEKDRLEVEGQQINLLTERDGEGWPRMITLQDEAETGQIGLSRLSGHSFYELAWDGGLHMRRFEISGTTRNRVPFEHIEVALRLAEAIGAQENLQGQPVAADEVEAAYLRRMKVKGARIGPPQLKEVPKAIQGRPVASYQVGDILVTMLQGGDDFAYATKGTEEVGLLLRRDSKRGVMAALPVKRGRPQRGNPLMTTPLAELDKSFNRALCAWAAWLVRVVK